MALHFTRDEFQQRQDRVTASLRDQGLAALLIFRQETMYYLTGFDTSGYVFFQALVLTSDGRMTLLTRLPDLLQAKHTSVIEDVRVWKDHDSANPLADLTELLREMGLTGETIGLEMDAFGLTARWYEALKSSLSGLCRYQDASELVTRLRAIKSPAELGYLRKAVDLADRALAIANDMAIPGAYEGDILAAMQSFYFEEDADYPSMDFIIGSGRDALLCRYFAGRRRLDAQDQMTLEFAASYRHYHAALMRTLLTGQASSTQLAMHAACRDALQACQETLRPGRPLGPVFDAHAKVMDQAGYQAFRLNACGYGMGATFPPSWVDWPMIHSGNQVIAEPGMTLFLDMFLMDEAQGLTMSLSETVLVTETGAERLSKASWDLVIN